MRPIIPFPTANAEIDRTAANIEQSLFFMVMSSFEAYAKFQFFVSVPPHLYETA